MRTSAGLEFLFDTTLSPDFLFWAGFRCARPRYGTFDGARYTAEHVPNARFIGYPGGGHPLVGREKETMSEIIAFPRRSDARDIPSRQ